jgi:hypothetical protein
MPIGPYMRVRPSLRTVEVEEAMGAIMIRCPTTNQLVAVGIDTDKESFESLPNVAATPVHCPLCGQEHAWSKADAILETTGRAAQRK